MNYEQQVTEYKKLLKSGDKIIVDRPQIKHLQYQVTQNCNSFRCKTCGLWAIKSKGELSYEEFERFFYNQSDFEHVDLTGGEVFLTGSYYNLFELLFNDQKLKKVSVTTNGILTDRILEIAELSKTSIPQLKMYLSFDGLEKENDVIRGKGSFEAGIKTLESIINLQHSKFEVGISTTISDYNASRFEEIREFFKKYNINLNSINVPNQSDFYKNRDNKYLFLSAKNVPQDIQHRQHVIDYLTCEDVSLDCISGISKIVLDAKGNLRVCSMNWTDDFVIGNIRNHDLSLEKTLQQNKGRYLEIQRKSVNKQCRKCFSSCEYGCWKYDLDNKERLQ